MGEDVTVFLFVRGNGESAIEKLVAHAQCAAALDTLERLRTIPEIGALVVATADPEFGRLAAALGAQVELDPPETKFHWGRRIATLREEYEPAVALYIGGGSGALMSVEGWHSMIARVVNERDVLVTNNLYSCDFAAWSPADALAQIEPPTLDNDLAFRLGERGRLQVCTLPRNAATQLDIDTPTELLILSSHPGVGENLRVLLDRTRLDTGQIERVKAVMGDQSATVLIAGRVSSSTALFLEESTRCQWRVYSEERGMRASGREERGAVRSLLGSYLDRVGAAGFADSLVRLADAVILDTRVLFAHRGLHPTATDRFHSDLMQADEIHDPFVREFTAAMRGAGIPVILGGHSLVSGGVYALAEAA